MFRFVKDSLESLKDLRRFSFCSIVEAILTVGRIKQKYGYLWLVVHLQLVSCLVVGSFVKNTQSQKTVLISCLESHSFFSFYICCCSNLYKESKCPLWFSGQWTVNIVKIRKIIAYVHMRTYAKSFWKTTVFTVQCPVILIYRHTRKPGDSETLFSGFLISWFLPQVPIS